MLIEASIVLFLFLLAWWYFKEEDPVDKLPGPPRLPLIGNAHQLMRLNPDKLLEAFMNFTNTYGYRYITTIMNKKIVHIVDPHDVEAILSHSKNIKKSFPYQLLKDWLGDGLLVSTGSHWHKRRKVLTPAFHFNILKNFSTIIQEKTRDLLHILKEKNGTDVDVMPVISNYTLFTICETAMGTKLDKDLSATTAEYKNAILQIGQFILSRLLKFWKWNSFIFNLSSQGRQYFKILDSARIFTDNVIIERRAKHKTESKKDEMTTDSEFGTKRRLAMLDLLLEAEARGEIDLKGIRDEVNTFMFEGHDTTAMALTFGLMLLADYEDIQERIFQEVMQVLGDFDRTPSISDLADMKYLEAVIKEVLRLYPSVPFIERQIVENFMLGNILIKKGTITDIHIYELHHREDIFPDPEAFKPERFLGTEMRHPYAYVPFSAGPRNCIGQRFAMQEMKCTFCEIVRNFKLVPKVKGARPNIMADMVLRPVDPIYIKFIQR